MCSGKLFHYFLNTDFQVFLTNNTKPASLSNLSENREQLTGAGATTIAPKPQTTFLELFAEIFCT